MPAQDTAITTLPLEVPVAGDRLFYIKDPNGSPAPRGCTVSQLLEGISGGSGGTTGNIRITPGKLEIFVEGLDQWWELHARANEDNEAELYLQPPTGIGGEGGEAIGGEGGEIVGEE